MFNVADISRPAKLRSCVEYARQQILNVICTKMSRPIHQSRYVVESREMSAENRG